MSTGTGEDVEKRRRLWIVGEGPPGTVWSAARDRLGAAKAERFMSRLALTGAVGRRLAGLLDEPWPDGMVPWHQGAGRYVLRNLQDVPWSVRRFSLLGLLPRVEGILAEARARREPVLVLGRKVALAFGVHLAPFCSWTERGRDLIGLLPHPSRRSLWWNDRQNAEEALSFLRSARLGLDLGLDPRGEGSWTHLEAGELVGFPAGRTRAEAVEDLERTLAPHVLRYWTAQLVFRRDVEGGPGVPSVTSATSAWISRHERRAHLPGRGTVG